MGGYAGRILRIDLSTGTIEVTPLDLNFAREHIGGLGFGTRIYLDLIRRDPNFDALSGKNPFVLMTGPLTGIRMDAVARWTVGSKSPLTGFWGESNIGGFFGAELKFAGYDGIVITGEADRPTYVTIEDDTVEIRDGQKYWNKDVYTVNDQMTADHGGESKKSGQVLTIGPAGESLVRFASIINNKGHAAGRTGMGAVWGAKKLKAIFVRGTRTVEIAHPERLESLRAELKALYADHLTIEALRTFGTASHMDIGVITGDIPMKNWQQADWEHFDEIGPLAYSDRILTGRKTCYACGVACKREAAVKEGPFRFQKGPGPEYETIATFGTMCLNSSIESIGKANDICNRYGMDTITCGATIAFAIECFENGLINKTDTDGLHLTWGSSEAIVAMTEKIGKKEGLGSILSEGSARAAKHLGSGASEFLTTVKGVETPMHDPRFAHGFGLAYAVSPRGACHNASLNFPIESGAMYLPDIPELAHEITEMSSEGKAALNVACQDFGMFFSSCAVFCNLGAMILSATQAVNMVNHVTGFDYTIAEVMELGRRIWYLKRGLSNLFGARAEHDRLPKRLLRPLEGGPTRGSVPDMDLMLKEFYELRGLNDKGIPRKEILENLGLDQLAALLYTEQ
jgi:aldehyde:ferredoxin oxidoreductase